MDLVTYALLKKYVQASLAGAGALQGNDGKSAYEVAKQNGYSGSEKDWLNSLKGDAGESPHIGDNGNWFIGSQDTGISAHPSMDYNDLTNLPSLNGTEIKGDISIPEISIEEIDEFLGED